MLFPVNRRLFQVTSRLVGSRQAAPSPSRPKQLKQLQSMSSRGLSRVFPGRRVWLLGLERLVSEVRTKPAHTEIQIVALVAECLCELDCADDKPNTSLRTPNC